MRVCGNARRTVKRFTSWRGRKMHSGLFRSVRRLTMAGEAVLGETGYRLRTHYASVSPRIDASSTSTV